MSKSNFTIYESIFQEMKNFAKQTGTTFMFSTKIRRRPYKAIDLNKANWNALLAYEDLILYSQWLDDKRIYAIGTRSKKYETIHLPEDIFKRAGVNSIFLGNSNKLLDAKAVHKIIQYAIDNGLYYHPIEELI